jgi:hypothetical protein
VVNTKLPDSIHLALRSGHFSSRDRSETLNLDNFGNGKHDNTAMLNLGLTNPVKINSNLVHAEKARRIKTNITRHGLKNERRSAHEGGALLILELNAKLRLDP